MGHLPSNNPAYKLIFGDEFDGNGLNPSRWKIGVPWGDVTTGEDQIYKSSALSLNSGVLSMTASKGGSNGRSYTSGAINSDNRFEFTYGYLEARARVPSGRGLWPAIWLQTAGQGQFNEIDVLEVLGQDTSANHVNLHQDSNRWKDGVTYTGPDLSDGFHVYAVDWEPERVVWYLDGIEIYRSEGHVLANPMEVIINLTVGGQSSWSGPPDSRTHFPATFQIDYVRVYQRR